MLYVSCPGLNPAAHLASVSSTEENDFIYSLVEDASPSYVWLGGSDSYSEGNWTWNDETLFEYDNWYGGSQGNGGPSQNCLVMDANKSKLGLIWNAIISTSSFVK